MSIIHASEVDAEIEVQVSKRGGIWAYTLQPGRSRQIHSTGKLPAKGATRHTLLAVAMTSALMAIHEKEWHRLRGDKMKPKVVIDIPDQAFIGALEFRRRSKATPTDGFRVSKNLLRPLYQQLTRFDVTLRFRLQEKKEAADLSNAERLLRSWFSFGETVFSPALTTK